MQHATCDAQRGCSMQSTLPHAACTAACCNIFRFSEAVAFLGGHGEEHAALTRDFLLVLANQLRLIVRQVEFEAQWKPERSNAAKGKGYYEYSKSREG